MWCHILPDIFHRHDGSRSLQCELCSFFCSLGYVKLWTEPWPHVFNILHFVISDMSGRQWCCSITSVHWTGDNGEGATIVPNILVCCKVSVFTCFSCSSFVFICTRTFNASRILHLLWILFFFVFAHLCRRWESFWTVILGSSSSLHYLCA